MPRRCAHAVLAAALAASLALDVPPRDSSSSPERVVAIGDIHGAIDSLREILRAAALIDPEDRWSGGTAVLVQTGDYLDRGEAVREVLDLLMRLEDEARRAGGRVEVLLGNHEAMNILHDLRDVAPDAYARFADGGSEERRESAYLAYEASMKERVPPARRVLTRRRWLAAHPPGFLEYLDALGPSGPYGQWLRSRKVVHMENGTIFMHAGIPPDWEGSLEDVNSAAAQAVASWDAARERLVNAGLILPFFDLPEMLTAVSAEVQRIAAAVRAGKPPGDHVTHGYAAALRTIAEIDKSVLLAMEGPLWFRGLATWPDFQGRAIGALLQRFSAERFVAGHTMVRPGRVTSRFSGRVFLIDTGMLATVYGGRPGALELQGGRISAIYPHRREILVDAPRPSRREAFGERASSAHPIQALSVQAAAKGWERGGPEEDGPPGRSGTAEASSLASAHKTTCVRRSSRSASPK